MAMAPLRSTSSIKNVPLRQLQTGLSLSLLAEREESPDSAEQCTGEEPGSW